MLMNRFWLIPLFFALFVLGPFLIWGDSLTVLFSPQGTVDALAEYASIGWMVGICLIVADLFLPIPTTAVIAALGILYGPYYGTLAALAGSLLAAALGYGIGRGLGRPAAKKFIGSALESGERIFDRYGGWIVVASRWMPLLPEVVSCVAGVSRMRFLPFLGAVFCGALPLSAIFATFGHLGADAPVWTLAISALAPIALWYLADRSGLVQRFELDPRIHKSNATGSDG